MEYSTFEEPLQDTIVRKIADAWLDSADDQYCGSCERCIRRRDSKIAVIKAIIEEAKAQHSPTPRNTDT